MPVIAIPLDALRERLGAEIPRDRLLRVLEEIGCDVEGFALLPRTRCARCGWIEERTPTEDPPARCDRCDADHRQHPSTLEDLPEIEVVRMELLAVRPDMFDPGGLARALRGYLDLERGAPVYEVGPQAATVRVDPSVRLPGSHRPHIACAVLENVRLDEGTLKVLMKLQENLHWALGRNRKLASIGVYDFDTVVPEIEYTSEDPSAYAFVPLGVADGVGMTLREILDRHPKGRAFRHLLDSFDRYPILRDRTGTVLSGPPIINSEETKVHLGSRNLFIDVTGLGQRVVQRALNILVTSMLENLSGARLRAVAIEGASDMSGRAGMEGSLLMPDLTPQPGRVAVEKSARLLGIRIEAGQAVELLERMRHDARESNEGVIDVSIPAYRNDILHENDLIEDLAIAYGYHRIAPELLPARTVGKPRALETLTSHVREVLCGLGFHESLTMILSSDEEHDRNLGRPPDDRAVRIANPISTEQTRLRRSLLPGLLQIFRHNRHQPLPQRVFEVGDVVDLDEQSETRARERRSVGFGIIGPKVGFTDARAYAEAVAREFGVTPSWEAASEAPFLKGRCARLLMPDGAVAGMLGEVDPDVLARFGLENPSVLAELSVDLLAGRTPLQRFELED